MTYTPGKWSISSARIMAVAPDMFLALKELVDTWDKAHDGVEGTILHVIVDNARAAISAAEVGA